MACTDERIWLAERLELEQRSRKAVYDYTVLESLVNPRVLGLSLVYFGAVATNYGLSFFLPQIVKAFGLNIFLTALVSATPYDVGTIGMMWWGGARIAWPSAGSIPPFRCSLRRPASLFPPRSMIPC